MPNDYLTKTEFNSRIDSLERKILDGVRELLSLHLVHQEGYIKNKLDSINLLATVSSSKALDFQVQLLEKRVETLENR